MRAHVVSLAALAAVAFAPAAWAADVIGQSQIMSVIVFPTGAEITRMAKVRLEAGDHTVFFKELPAQAVAGSIRVEGKSVGRLEIGSVDTRQIQVPRADPAEQATERRRLELEIEKLRDEKRLIDAQVKAAEAQKALIGKLTELPAHPAPVGTPAAPAVDWNQIFSLIGQRFAEAQKSEIEASIKAREIDRKIEDLQKKLAAVAPAQDARTEVKVFVAAGAPLEAELAIRYQVSSASWTPYYDARLVTGAKTTAPNLALVRRASVQQRSGEDWTNVAMSLSTTRPGTGTSAPELYPMTVDYEPDMPPPRPVAMAPAAPAPAVGALRSRQVTAEAVSDADAKRKDEGEAVSKAAEERRATVDVAAFQAVFGVPGKLTVLTTGEQKRVQLDSADVEPALVVRTVPRLNAKAYLYAKLTTPKTTPYLPGVISLFRDGTFVGTGRLPQLSPGEEFELGFGADDSVRVRHAVVDEKRAETGIISTSKTDQRNFRISVKNLHERPIQLSIMDQIPVSQNQDIKVDFTAKTQPSRRDVDDKRGTLAWDSKVEPDEERIIEFGYRVSWPSAKRVQYGR